MNSSNGTMWDEGVCTVCGTGTFLDILKIKGIPAQDGVIWHTKDEAIKAPKGDISLSLCLNCSFVGNRTFEPELLKFVGYNVSLEYSPLYQKFTNSLAAGLIQRYGIRNKTVLEIACGNGYFLKTVCKLGENQGVGMDPSYTDLDGSGNEAKGIQFIKDYYSERYAEYEGDLVACRQLIDILGSPKAFLKMVRKLIGDKMDTVVYFEVPNPVRRLQQFVPWNVGYEHGSFFFPESLRLLFELSGFEVKNISPCHSGDYLGIEAVPSAAPSSTPVSMDETSRLADDLSTLSSRFETEVAGWKDRLEELNGQGTRVIPWGAGEPGIGFMNILDIRDQMPYIVDINPDRMGKFIPGTGTEVVAPEFLVEYKPELVIITNSTYETEIKDQVKELGVTCDFLVL